MYLRTSGVALLAVPDGGTPNSSSFNTAPSMISKLLGGLGGISRFQLLIRTVAVTEYRPGCLREKYGARSTCLVATLEDSRTNSPNTGTSSILGTRRPAFDSTEKVSQSSSAPRCKAWPDRLVM